MGHQSNQLGPKSNRSSRSKPVIAPIYNKNKDEPVPTVSITIQEYLKESTIHGLKFLLEPHWWQRMFWIVAIVICVAISVYFNVQVMEVDFLWNNDSSVIHDLIFWYCNLANQVFLKWSREPIYVAFNTQSTPIHKVPFPAITVCNMNQVNLDAVNAIHGEIASDSSSDKTNHMLMLRAGLLQGMCDDIDFGLDLNEVMS